MREGQVADEAKCPITGEHAEPWVSNPERAACPWDFEYPLLESRYGTLVCACCKCRNEEDRFYECDYMWVGRSEEADVWLNDGND